MIYTETTEWRQLPYAADGHYLAIGDVHGRAELLEGALDHANELLSPDGCIILLGDLIDRGPASLACLDLAIARLPSRSLVSIAGNHESMLLHTLESNPGCYRIWDLWLQNGGTTVLKELYPNASEDDVTISMLAEGLGPTRFEYLRSMAPHRQAAGVLFAHAGLHPHRDVGTQLAQPVKDVDLVLSRGSSAESMRWIREPWVGHTGDIGRFVVYGHTIMHNGPLWTDCQLGIDLGAFSTGILCAAEIDGDRARCHFHRT